MFRKKISTTIFQCKDDVRKYFFKNGSPYFSKIAGVSCRNRLPLNSTHYFGVLQFLTKFPPIRSRPSPYSSFSFGCLNMWNRSSQASSTGSWMRNISGGMSWTTAYIGNTTEEIETMHDGSSTGSGSEPPTLTTSHSCTTPTAQSQDEDAIEQIMSQPCEFTDGSWVCHPYKIETLERQLFHNSPGAARRTAVIETLRQSECNFIVLYTRD